MGVSRIIVLDPESGQQLGAQVRAILQREPSCRVDLIRGPIADLKESSDIGSPIVIPVLPPSKRGANALLKELRAWHPAVHLVPVVRLESLTEVFDDLVRCTDDFLVTPLREDEARIRVERFLSERESRLERLPLPDRMNQGWGLAQLIGEDPVFAALKQKIKLVAQFESTVLLTGETGTGKERVARALHYMSRRAEKPFLPVNCGAIPSALFESELYGRQKGAFTGALTSQRGLIDEANGGTLYLDEIETLSLEGQVKILRFLQDQTYYSVGSPKPRQANVWIIASSNVELLSKIQDGTFREDLFYRLAVITLAIPPLRLRRADIPLLAAHFWRLYAPKSGRGSRTLSSEAMEALCQYSWPGNVRELENAIQQIIILTEAPIIKPEDLPIPKQVTTQGSSGDSFKHGKALAIEDFERAYVTELLRVHDGNVTHAAQKAKKDRRAFGRLVKKYGIGKH